MTPTGFVDLQVNGYKGTNFSACELDEGACREACREVLSKGTAAFLPTVITSPEEVYRRNLPLIARVMDDSEFTGRLLGFHIEGPFISPKPGAVGAHRSDWVHKPDVALLERMQEWAGGKIRLLTVAAELDGIEALIRRAVKLGIVVSLEIGRASCRERV
jgi:N-acetylglucosamine-6-phosphate deacetylase